MFTVTVLEKKSGKERKGKGGSLTLFHQEVRPYEALTAKCSVLFFWFFLKLNVNVRSCKVFVHSALGQLNTAVWGIGSIKMERRPLPCRKLGRSRALKFPLMEKYLNAPRQEIILSSSERDPVPRVSGGY